MPAAHSATSIASRIKGKFKHDPATGCDLWVAGHSSQGRYPTIAAPGTGKPVYVYRAIWEEANGPIPSYDRSDFGSRPEIHHRCGNRSCVRLACLQLLERRQHIALHSFQRRWGKAVRKLSLNGTGVFIGGLQGAA